MPSEHDKTIFKTMTTVPWQNLKNIYKGGTFRNLNFEILSMWDVRLA
jgi:hypothetical protein